MLLSKILPEAARLHPSKAAIKTKDQIITYEQLAVQVNRVAGGLERLAVQPGDRVALLGHPCPYLAIAEFAVMAIGAIPVPVSSSLAPIEIIHILEDANPAAIIYDESFSSAATVLDAVKVEHSISCREAHGPHSLETFIANQLPFSHPYEAVQDDVALIIYTGGTTGRSKGVMHSHRTIHNWSSMNPPNGIGFNPTRKALVPNLAHLTGQYTLWSILLAGGCLVFAEQYPLRTEEIVEIVEREQLGSLGTIGLMFRDLVHSESSKAGSLQSLRVVTCGGAPIHLSTFTKAFEILPNTQLNEVYSQTESGNFISYLSISQCVKEGKLHRLLSVGNPAHMGALGQKEFQVRIVDDAGCDVAQGEMGEIICQGSQIMLGYWNNPAETNKVLKEGWLHTGDIGKMDEDGYLYLLDRKKDIIIVNGSNVYGSEVEQVVSKHPSILEVAVIGTPLEVEGEEVTAVVSLVDGSELTLEDLRQHCMDQLAAYKIPTQLHILEAIPRTNVGKMNKALLKKGFWDGRVRLIQ